LRTLRVGEARLLHPADEVLAEHALRLVGQVVLGLFQHRLGDGYQLVHPVRSEIEVMSDP
jgi:hypothetical protein